MFTAIQDNDENSVNELKTGFSENIDTDNMMDKIKKSGTVRSSAAFELDDLTAPVELVARENTAKKKWAHRHTNWRNPHRWKVSQERRPTAATFSERRKPHTFDLTTW